jgi:hypothetical protein
MEEQEQHIGSEVNKVRWVGDDIDNIARNQDRRFAPDQQFCSGPPQVSSVHSARLTHHRFRLNTTAFYPAIPRISEESLVQQGFTLEIICILIGYLMQPHDLS